MIFGLLPNLFNNVFYATSEKQKAESIRQNAEYELVVSIQTEKATQPYKIIHSFALGK